MIDKGAIELSEAIANVVGDVWRAKYHADIVAKNCQIDTLTTRVAGLEQENAALQDRVLV